MNVVASMQNPFTYCVPELINIVYGHVASHTEKLLRAYDDGKKVADKYVKERLNEKTVDFQAPVKKVCTPGFKPKPSTSKVSDALRLRLRL